MKNATTKLYNWSMEKASSTRAPLWIALLFGLELFLFIPLDAVLMFFCLQNKRNIFLYIAIAAAASTLSATLGYLLGHFLWDLIGPYVVPHLVSTALFAKISHHFQAYEHWATFLGAILPFPLKALSLTAGVFHLHFASFVCCLFAARVTRFALIGGAMALWGEKVKEFVDRHFHRLILLVFAKVAAVSLFFWILAH
jgi:membrane protein YqaA with SNARE-associated domain